MTDNTGDVSPAPREVNAPVRAMLWTGLRALGVTVALVALYYLLPLDRISTLVAATILVIGLVALVALVVFQVRWILRSRFPGLRAVEALATSLPLFLLLFSGTYVVLAAISASNFGEKLTHTDALYFPSPCSPQWGSAISRPSRKGRGSWSRPRWSSISSSSESGPRSSSVR